MSRRVNAARRLAGWLSKASGVDVIVRCMRDADACLCVWIDGPSEAEMRALVELYRSAMNPLQLSDLDWKRMSSTM